MSNKIVFTVNGHKHEISANIDCQYSLNDYLRLVLNLRGTKVMCREGGCGICIVNIKGTHPVTGQTYTYAINSCLVSPFSCHNKDITTIEGIGNKLIGYHQIQTRLAKFNGSQCGFCSPGWVMNMYSALKSSDNKLTMTEIENYFAGNLCRCTGYRPILDAMKSFATDANHKLQCQIKDIEDAHNSVICTKTGRRCARKNSECNEDDKFCFIELNDLSIYENNPIEIDFKDHKWIKVYTVQQIFDCLSTNDTDSYMFVAGNTAKGVYHEMPMPYLLIDITDVCKLRINSVGTNLEVGSGTTLSELMKIFDEISNVNDYYAYTKQLRDHLDLVAHYPVRNIGTIAGNLSIKHMHNEFPSDVFLILETIGAKMTIADKTSSTVMSLPKYLNTNMKGKLILNVLLPPLSRNYILKTYKITPRVQNAHAMVNAGFLIKLVSESSTIVQSATIVFGNINKTFIHATNTEMYLEGKNLYEIYTVKEAIRILSDEINPDFRPPEYSPKYRKMLATCLFYKFILSTIPDRFLNQKYLSGGTLLDRPLSSGKQVYDTNRSQYPLNQPVIKLEAQDQCSGEAKYINDIPTMPNELITMFVVATIPRGVLVNIDASDAQKIDGVEAIYTATDIPGVNLFTSYSVPTTLALEEIFVDIGGTVKHYGQPIGIIVGSSEHILLKALPLIKITYKDITQKAVLTIQDALKAPSNDNRVVNIITREATNKGHDIKKVVNGIFELKSQYHFYMETQSCVCIPTEDGLEVHTSTQWMDHVNAAVAGMLKKDLNFISVITRRLGGSYGGKVTRASQIACACALAAYKLNRPVRMILPMEVNMGSIGKKHSTSSNYEIGIDQGGVIQYMKNTSYSDNGCSSNESVSPLPSFIGSYDSSTWTVSINSVLTDNSSSTWLRAPGTCEGIAMIENIMERISMETGIDPIDVRLRNLPKDDKIITGMIEHLVEIADYRSRVESVNNFNVNNRWKKKGLNLAVMTFPCVHIGNFYAIISIYHVDGSIAVTHSGIEMGQGINTKTAQVVAHCLDVPLNKITIKTSNSYVTPNAFSTGGSTGSELCCFAAQKACEIMNERLAPIKNALENPTWTDTIQTAYRKGIDLNATYMYNYLDSPVKSYAINGVCISEVEVDMLTGNHVITRVDILEDVGESLSPLIDVGQVEGAFMMGVGYYTSERLIFDPDNGELLTDRTWYYKIPGAKDIPVDFRVYFRRNAPNPLGVLRSKATGEPPLALSFSVALAIRRALISARTDAGLPNEWFELDYPLTPENILLASGTDPCNFDLL